MVCKQCGNEIAPGMKFCTVCGTPVEASAEPTYAQPQYAQPVEPQYTQPVQPQYTQPVEPQYAQPQYTQNYAPAGGVDERNLSKSTLIMGILSIAFASSFYLSFLGIIFGAIAKGKAKAYTAAGYPLTGRAKVGSILGKVGFILGIVLTVILFIYLIIAIISCATYSNSYSSYYYY